MSRVRIPIATILAAVALTLVVAGPASAAKFVAKLKTPSTQPTIGKLWVITVTAKSNRGKALKATAFYQFMFQNQVVSTQYPAPGTKGLGHSTHPYAFTGSYNDELLFPARSAAIPLTLRVLVTVKGLGTIKLDHPVRAGK